MEKLTGSQQRLEEETLTDSSTLESKIEFEAIPQPAHSQQNIFSHEPVSLNVCISPSSISSLFSHTCKLEAQSRYNNDIFKRSWECSCTKLQSCRECEKGWCVVKLKCLNRYLFFSFFSPFTVLLCSANSVSQGKSKCLRHDGICWNCNLRSYGYWASCTS